MSRRLSLLLAFLLSCVALAGPAPAQLALPAEQPIRIGRFPAVSPDGERICFTYQGNLWISPAAGGPATRLTANDSYDSNPRWSADGKWIAFNSDREGGSQVFVIPAVGGPARQLTFHSVATTVHDWFPDGGSLVVTTSRDTLRPAIYRLEIESGRLRRLVQDETKCLFPALSPDGKWVAYTRGALVDVIRKGYRGSANYDVYLAPVDGSAAPRRLTESDTNDMWPMWAADGKMLYFTSERKGTAALWKQPVEGGKAAELVPGPPDAIRYPTVARDGSLIAFECENRICTVSPRGGSPKDVPILCRTDERGPRTIYATYSGENVSEFALSPEGKRVALVIRGEIFVASTEKSIDARRLTDNPTRDGDVAWAPDGKSLVYSSNRDGGYRLYRTDLETRETKQLTRGTGIDTDPAFSPDGKWIAFRRGPKTGLFLIRPDGTGEAQAVSGPKIGTFRWAPDGRWLAYEREDEIRTDDVWLIPLEAAGEALKPGTPVNVTDHPGYNQGPQWAPNGEKLVFRSNRYRNRDIETINHTGRFSLYTVTLEREKEKLDEDDPLLLPPAKPAEKKEEKKVEIKLDPREIERRARQIVTLEEGIGAFAISPDSKTVVFVAGNGRRADLWQVALEGGTLQRLTTSGEAPFSLAWAPDSSRFYYLTNGTLRWMGRGGTGSGTVGFTARMEIDRLVDYRAAFDETWQLFNDTFYDRTFRGLDWKAVGQKYRALVEHVTTRQDFYYLVTQMFGELNASHTGISGGAARAARDSGYLGISVDEEYTDRGVRVASVLARGPADRDESRLKPGEYIVSIDEEEVRTGAAYDRALAGKAGRTVTLLVNDRPVKDGARKVRLKTITASAVDELLYEQKIDRARALAEKTSGGRVGYLHVADMGDQARNRFERELFSIGQRKEAMVLDFRDNSGGDTHDSLLRILARNRHYFTFAPRLETPFPQPERAYVKPVILLINEGSLSDAEVFANGFRELGLGKIVGVPTMGWIIFTSSRALVDGSRIRTPHLGCYTLDGRDMENWGVPPDLRVENTPADERAGRDPQLERAIEELLKDSRLRK